MNNFRYKFKYIIKLIIKLNLNNIKDYFTIYIDGIFTRTTTRIQ